VKQKAANRHVQLEETCMGLAIHLRACVLADHGTCEYSRPLCDL